MTDKEMRDAVEVTATSGHVFSGGGTAWSYCQDGVKLSHVVQGGFDSQQLLADSQRERQVDGVEVVESQTTQDAEQEVGPQHRFGLSLRVEESKVKTVLPRSEKPRRKTRGAKGLTSATVGGDKTQNVSFCAGLLTTSAQKL